ncbi:pilus assembly PilX family protein [Aquabacterium sp.]|uniref:pilus assembly PilX family protein n=1 Tax=Aquabacterium sp. TaxID=1872578 RepID=UPI003D6D12F6
MVLIVALVMLVIIGLTSAAVMRNSLNADMVSQNSRRQTQATQAAQMALRYCENLAINSIPLNTYVKAAAAAGTEELWKVFANWPAPSSPVATSSPSATTGLVSVPNSVLAPNANTSTDKFRFAPQCMSQYRTVGSKNLVVVTARGFSSDYQETSGRTESGSVVWLQSILRVSN